MDGTVGGGHVAPHGSGPSCWCSFHSSLLSSADIFFSLFLYPHRRRPISLSEFWRATLGPRDPPARGGLTGRAPFTNGRPSRDLSRRPYVANWHLTTRQYFPHRIIPPRAHVVLIGRSICCAWCRIGSRGATTCRRGVSLAVVLRRSPVADVVDRERRCLHGDGCADSSPWWGPPGSLRRVPRVVAGSIAEGVLFALGAVGLVSGLLVAVSPSSYPSAGRCSHAGHALLVIRCAATARWSPVGAIAGSASSRTAPICGIGRSWSGSGRTRTGARSPDGWGHRFDLRDRGDLLPVDRVPHPPGTGALHDRGHRSRSARRLRRRSWRSDRAARGRLHLGGGDPGPVETGSTPSLMLAGDSVPRHLTVAIDRAMTDRGWRVFSATFGSCPVTGEEPARADGTAVRSTTHSRPTWSRSRTGSCRRRTPRSWSGGTVGRSPTS